MVFLAKKDVHRFNNGEGSYYSIPVEKSFYTTVKSQRKIWILQKAYEPILQLID